MIANADTIAAFINTALFYTNNIQLSQNWAACLAVTVKEQDETQSILDYFDIDDTADGIDTANTAETEHNTTTTHTANHTGTVTNTANNNHGTHASQPHSKHTSSRRKPFNLLWLGV